MPRRTILRLTKEIGLKCDLLDQMIHEFLVARRALDGSHHTYESNSEASNLLNLTIRHVEGVIALARTDLVLLPPAQVAARSAFESSVRAAWLVQPDDPFERETRWLAHFAGEQDYMRRQIRELDALSADASACKRRLDSLTEFRNRVASLLAAKGYATDSVVPNFRDCLRSLGEERTYGLYSFLSQTAHATHSSTWLYRSEGVGAKKIEGEFVSADQWNLPLDICRFIFKTPATLILARLGADPTRLSELVR